MKKVEKTTSPFRYDLNPLSLYSEGNKLSQGIRSDRVPEELWAEDYNIVQEAVTKTIPKKKMQEGKVIVRGDFTNS